MRVLMPVHSNYEHDIRVQREAETLAGIGYEVTVLSLWPDHSRTEPYRRNGVSIIPEVIGFKHGIPRFASMMKRIARFIRQNREYDIIHAHDLDTAFPAVNNALPTQTVIYDSHEWYRGNIALRNKPLKRKIWQNLENRVVKRADRLITVNESIATLFRQTYQTIKDDITVVRNFSIPAHRMDADELWIYNESSSTAQLLRNLKQNSSYIAFYGGHLTKGRGLPHYLDAVRQSSNVGLVIAGSGKLEKWLKEKLREESLNQKAIYAGHLTLPRLYGLMRFCDVGLSYIEPLSESYYYALPNKLTEYLQNGLPVVASNLPEIKNLVTRYGIGRIAASPKEFYKILTKLDEIVDNPKIQNNITQAADKLHWDREKENLLALYHSIEYKMGPLPHKL